MQNQMEVVYICPFCFRACDHEGKCHGQEMIGCYVGEPGSALRRPMTDFSGSLYSRAPRWYLEARGWIDAGPPYTPLR